MTIIAAAPRVRPAAPDDAEAVAAMARASAPFRGGTPRLSAEAFRRDGFGRSAAFRALVADSGDGACGYAIFYWGYDTASASRGVCLADLFVEEARRRRGVGGALVRGVARLARSEGARWMFWPVLKRNRGARRFYRALAPELKSVVLCGAFGPGFERIADAGTP